MKIGGLEIGKEKPMRISAEIVDSTEKTEEEIKNTIKNYEEQGADLIDLGIPIATNEDELVRTVEIAKKFTNKPLSVDTVNPDLIKKSIDLGIDLVLSVTPKNIEEVEDYLSGVNCVVAARDKLKNTVERARESGANAIADPILDPPNEGLVDSLVRYYEYRNNEQDAPLFFGIGNVTEMIDADSTGVNAIMSSIASELNVSILFTAQASSKTKYGVRELKKASKLNFLAKNKKTTPKDLGIDLLYLKDKKRKEVETKVGGRTIEAEEEKGYEEDEGYFEIGIDREEKKILAVFYKNKKQEPKLTIKGETAKSITDKIKDLKIIKKENHFFYLGRELKKAEIALKTGKNYLQGTDLF
ncbi:dihydropteroate synthase-like protein [archaeon SCG-AAA382B04]|nr:dihydropteroate synthase-like protein [archaeon SCG-AAA382B04]